MFVPSPKRFRAMKKDSENEEYWKNSKILVKRHHEDLMRKCVAQKCIFVIGDSCGNEKWFQMAFGASLVPRIAMNVFEVKHGYRCNRLIVARVMAFEKEPFKVRFTKENFGNVYVSRRVAEFRFSS